MATLTDRLEYVIGVKAADALAEHFGIVTVDDLLRHYPRKYSKGSTAFGDGDAPPDEGEHITLIATVAKVRSNRARKTGKEFLVVTLDNLLKGAATQAVQNINLALGLPERLGVPHDQAAVG